jgi:hypothetical protein
VGECSSSPRRTWASLRMRFYVQTHNVPLRDARAAARGGLDARTIHEWCPFTGLYVYRWGSGAARPSSTDNADRSDLTRNIGGTDLLDKIEDGGVVWLEHVTEADGGV